MREAIGAHHQRSSSEVIIRAERAREPKHLMREAIGMQSEKHSVKGRARDPG
jgi:hypothetical protein